MIKINNKKRGFSIMEAVIALAVIVLVTAAALTVVLAAISARVKAVNKSEAQNFAYNVWECFKVSDDIGDFENNVEFACDGLNLRDYIAEENGNTASYSYDSTKNNFTATITANFADGKFNITVKDNKGDDIISFPYEKGAKS